MPILEKLDYLATHVARKLERARLEIISHQRQFKYAPFCNCFRARRVFRAVSPGNAVNLAFVDDFGRIGRGWIALALAFRSCVRSRQSMGPAGGIATSRRSSPSGSGGPGSAGYRNGCFRCQSCSGFHEVYVSAGYSRPAAPSAPELVRRVTGDCPRGGMALNGTYLAPTRDAESWGIGLRGTTVQGGNWCGRLCPWQGRSSPVRSVWVARRVMAFSR